MQVPSFNYPWVFSQLRIFFKATPKPTAKQYFTFVVSLIRKIKPYIMRPRKYIEWEDAVKLKIVDQAQYWRNVFEAQGLQYPITRCSISIRHYWADDRIRDNSNKSETLHDILVSSGIIVDDNDKCLYLNKAEAQSWKGEIRQSITLIHITAYDW